MELKHVPNLLYNAKERIKDLSEFPCIRLQSFSSSSKIPS